MRQDIEELRAIKSRNNINSQEILKEVGIKLVHDLIKTPLETLHAENGEHDAEDLIAPAALNSIYDSAENYHEFPPIPGSSKKSDHDFLSFYIYDETVECPESIRAAASLEEAVFEWI